MPIDYILTSELSDSGTVTKGNYHFDPDDFDLEETFSTEAEADEMGKRRTEEGFNCYIHPRHFTQYINIYLEDRAYGGPEEGGWYFTHGTPYASIPVMPKETTLEVRQRYQALVDQLNENRPSIGSVMSEGRYQIRSEKHPARAFPKHQPHYE